MRSVLSFIIMLLFFSSCCIEGKIDAARQVVNEYNTRQIAERQRVTTITNISGRRMSEGKIDSIIQERILKRLARFQEEMMVPGSYARKVDSLLQNNRAFRKNYKSIVLPLLDSLKKQNESFDGKVKLYMMIEDGLNIADYKLFDLAAFFGPGRYQIPDDKADIAIASFSPIIDSVLKFSEKYNLPGTASLVILGFADGTGFSNSGPLFETLTGYIGKKDVTKEELNQKLSELRAKELIKQLSTAFVKKSSTSPAIGKINVEYIGQGKGEAYPLPSIKDYTVDDSRRRIVLCYWVVLPD